MDEQSQGKSKGLSGVLWWQLRTYRIAEWIVVVSSDGEQAREGLVASAMCMCCHNYVINYTGNPGRRSN